MEIDAKIKKLILAKETWGSEELLETIEATDTETRPVLKWFDEKDWRCDFHYDFKPKTLGELRERLEKDGIDFDEEIYDLTELAESIEEKWDEHHADLGGKGWIDYE